MRRVSRNPKPRSGVKAVCNRLKRTCPPKARSLLNALEMFASTLQRGGNVRHLQRTPGFQNVVTVSSGRMMSHLACHRIAFPRITHVGAVRGAAFGALKQTETTARSKRCLPKAHTIPAVVDCVERSLQLVDILCLLS